MAKKKEENEIKFDRRNYRIHDDRNKELIKKSLSKYGAGRSILIDADNEIIAGNGVFEQAQALGMNIKVVESDGKDLIAVKRTDLTTESEERKELAVMDNSTSDTSKFDHDTMKNDFGIPKMEEMGVPVFEASSVDDIDSFFEDAEEKTKKPKTVKCPHCGEEFEI